MLAAAAALSFDTLRDLAEAVRMPARLAPLLPIAIDAGAAVSCAIWLSHRVDDHTATFARRMTICLLALTVVGNAAQLGMHANDVAPPWWVAVGVGAAPPVVVGATVHLVVLVSRTCRDAGTPPARVVVDGGIRDRAQRLIADGAGRPRVAAELGLTDHQARRLVQELRQPPTQPHDYHNQHGASATAHEERNDHRDDVPEP